LGDEKEPVFPHKDLINERRVEVEEEEENKEESE